jgi:hypothetical protein
MNHPIMETANQTILNPEEDLLISKGTDEK